MHFWNGARVFRSRLWKLWTAKLSWHFWRHRQIIVIISSTIQSQQSRNLTITFSDDIIYNRAREVTKCKSDISNCVNSHKQDWRSSNTRVWIENKLRRVVATSWGYMCIHFCWLWSNCGLGKQFIHEISRLKLFTSTSDARRNWKTRRHQAHINPMTITEVKRRRWRSVVLFYWYSISD